MKRAVPIVLVAVLVLVIGIQFARHANKSDSPAKEPIAGNAPVLTATVAVIESTGNTGAGPAPPLPGEMILRDYANTNLPPENDLTLMSRLMENALLLLKSAANHPLSANEDWAGLLLGRNAARERFLPDHHVAVNERGQLVDRWGTALFIHAVGGGRYEIRSAGPDRRLWSDDDVHRDSDGRFRRGDQLNPPSLFAPDR